MLVRDCQEDETIDLDDLSDETINKIVEEVVQSVKDKDYEIQADDYPDDRDDTAADWHYGGK